MTFWLSETRIANWLCSDPKTPDQSIRSGLEGDFWCWKFCLIFLMLEKNAKNQVFCMKFQSVLKHKDPFTSQQNTFPHLSDSPWLCHAFALESYLRKKCGLVVPSAPLQVTTRLSQRILSSGDAFGPLLKVAGRDSFVKIRVLTKIILDDFLTFWNTDSKLVVLCP